MTLLLLDIQPMMTVLEGVVMELQDCAFPLLQGKLMVKNYSNKIGLVQMKQFHLIVPCMSCSIWEKKHLYSIMLDGIIINTLAGVTY